MCRWCVISDCFEDLQPISEEMHSEILKKISGAPSGALVVPRFCRPGRPKDAEDSNLNVQTIWPWNLSESRLIDRLFDPVEPGDVWYACQKLFKLILIAAAMYDTTLW